MDKRFEKKYHLLEEFHWWFVSRREIISQLMEHHEKDIRILEIGCSGGQLLGMLKRMGFENAIGIDISSDAIKLCQDKNLNNAFVMDACKLAFNENKFDLIVASDVLEHIEKDLNAVSEWTRVLKGGGSIICFVPAFMFLWRNHDVANQHFRRYNRQQLSVLFEKNGLSIIRTSYWNFFLFFPISMINFFMNKIDRPSELKDELFQVPRLTNKVIYLLLKYENKLLRYFNLPVGVSLFLIAKK